MDTTAVPIFNNPSPHISASADLPGYVETWGVPGITMIVVPRTDAGTTSVLLDALDASIGYTTSCLPGVSEPYSDGRFGGEIRVWIDCGGTGSVVIAVAADDGGDVFYLAVVQAAFEDDLTVLERALSTVQYSG